MAITGVSRKSPDFLDRLFETGVEGKKFIAKLSSLHDKILRVASVYAAVPGALNEVSIALRSLKIITGLLAIPKLCKQVMSAIKAENASCRFFAVWGAINSTKKVIGTVEGVFYYLNQLQIIDKAALAWTTIVGYIFLPISIISTGIQGYQFGKRLTHMRTFNMELRSIKQCESSDKAKKLCKLLLSQQKQLKTYKVITKECPLKERLTSILDRLEKNNKEAETELRHIKRCIKNRVREQAGVAGTKTVLSTGGAVASILSLACPPAAVALAIAAVVMGVLSLATFVYSRTIPNGDFTENEKTLLFTRMHKCTKWISESILSKISSKIKTA